MYEEKLKFFQARYKEDDLISGIITHPIGSLSVGSPCLASFAHATTQPPQTAFRSTFGEPLIVKLEAQKPKPKPPKKTNGTNKNIIDQVKKTIKEGNDLHEVNEQIRKNIASFSLLFVFNNAVEREVAEDFVFTSSKPNGFFYNGKKPLIYDTHRSILLSSKETINDHQTGSQETFLTELNKALRDVRFLNYTYYDIKRSNSKAMISNIREIIKPLSTDYPNAISLYWYVGLESRVLIDTVSISFYKPSDVVPIFNNRKSEGVCMEVVLTNSELEKDVILQTGKLLTFRFIFAKFKENIFSIDGEKIARPSSAEIPNVTKFLYKILETETPNDSIFTPKKDNQNKKVGGNKKCAEL